MVSLIPRDVDVAVEMEGKLTGIPASVNDANSEGTAVVFLSITRSFNC